MSVYGTDIRTTDDEGFLDSVGSARLWPYGLPVTARGERQPGFPWVTPLPVWTGESITPAVPTLLCYPFAHNAIRMVQEC